jgi:hypothetical protein
VRLLFFSGDFFDDGPCCGAGEESTDFTTNEVERDALVDSVYDTAHYFVS